jgi:Amt family ammonium transporter
MRKLMIPAVMAGVAALSLCFHPGAPPKVAGAISAADTAWMLVATAMVLLMTPGLAFFYGGMVRPKNVVSTLFQSFVSMGVITLLWVVVGFSLAFGDSIGGLVGDPRTFFMFNGVSDQTHPDLSPTIPLLLFAMFQLKFAIITPALITGAFAERIRFGAYMLFLVLFSLFIYAPLAHWTWHPDGFLHKWGVLDFAGGTVVHMSAGFAALAGAMVLGKRHLAPDAPPAPANLPFVLLGTGLLWFGWFGFNAGSALTASPSATLAFATTNTAAAAAMLGWVGFEWMRGKKPSALGACIGAVVGLVAVTPAAGYITVAQSIVVGLVASGVSSIAVHLRSKTEVDDTLDVFPCHGIGGLTGMVLTGVFAKDVGLINGTPKTFLYHLLAIAVVGAFTFIGTYLLYRLVDAMMGLRVSREEEDAGLDWTQHGERQMDLPFLGAPPTPPVPASTQVGEAPAPVGSFAEPSPAT